jgi:hypothetical protein
MKRFCAQILAILLAANFTAALCAAEKPNATGTWKWSFTAQNGDTFESTAKLKQDADKLTGTVNGRFGEAEITDGAVKDDEIHFTIKRERDGQAFVVKYTGKISGDTIKGKTEFQRDGNNTTRDWEAKRQSAKAAAAGTWNTALILPDGNRIEGKLTLKQDGDKLTGNLARNDNETAIADGKISGDEVTFKVLRDRDGRTVTAKYKGKVTGDTVKGKVESDWSGDWQTLDWEGARAK